MTSAECRDERNMGCSILILAFNFDTDLEWFGNQWKFKYEAVASWQYININHS